VTTYYHLISGSRILQADRTDLSGTDDGDVTTGDDNLILAIHMTSNVSGKNPASQAWSLEWENATDDPGTWTSLSNTGELRYTATTVLTDGNACTSTEWACSIVSASFTDVDGTEREGSNADITMDLGPSEETEYQIAIETSNADKTNGDTYNCVYVK